MENNFINHIALVLDASSSMNHLKKDVVKVADNQIAYLAQRSQELDQETRVTVYTFDSVVECIIFDKDVLRLPSIAKQYSTKGMTALIDATIKSQKDLGHTAELYGDHAFLTYILTDGGENVSKTPNKFNAIVKLLAELPDHWTVAALVPNATSVSECKRFGFPKDNIAVWDASSVKGLDDAGSLIRTTTDTFMQQRSTGTFRGSRGLFNMGAENLNKKTVTANLTELAKSKFKVVNVGAVDAGMQIRDFVAGEGIIYSLGCAFYQLTKAEDIQAQKKICVMDKKTKKVYTGDQARDLLGLPAYTVRVRPEENPQFDVFVQSTSVNRKLVPNTKVLVMK